MANPLDGFTVDISQIRYVGDGLQRPECILAERDGTVVGLARTLLDEDSAWARSRTTFTSHTG
jgi:hypothetical protein